MINSPGTSGFSLVIWEYGSLPQHRCVPEPERVSSTSTSARSLTSGVSGSSFGTSVPLAANVIELPSLPARRAFRMTAGGVLPPSRKPFSRLLVTSIPAPGETSKLNGIELPSDPRDRATICSLTSPTPCRIRAVTSGSPRPALIARTRILRMISRALSPSTSSEVRV